jgi:hypothetical protein
MKWNYSLFEELSSLIFEESIVNKIPKDDYRYNMLLTIPIKKVIKQTYGWDISYNVYVVFQNKPYSSLIRLITKKTIVDDYYIDYVYDNAKLIDKDILNKYISGYTHRHIYC